MRGSAAWRVLAAGLAVVVILGLSLWIVRRDLLPIVLMVVGLLAFSGGIGFVLVPLVRLRQSPVARSGALLARPSFTIGLLVSVAGAALTVLGFGELVRRAVS